MEDELENQDYIITSLLLVFTIYLQSPGKQNSLCISFKGMMGELKTDLGNSGVDRNSSPAYPSAFTFLSMAAACVMIIPVR